jgi:hypothetical protein
MAIYPEDEYSHVVIDKNNVGLDTLRQKISEKGLLTAEASGYGDQMAEGSRKLRHHQHVFLWDESEAGVKGRLGILLDSDQKTVFVVRVRWPALTKDGLLFSGTLKGDGGHAGPPQGLSTNGAWAYEGNIPANFCFIEGLHSSKTPNYASWAAGSGW